MKHASPRQLVSRRGVASVLAMMFLVIFGSLAAAMAVVAQGNLRTADSGMKLSRAMSAAETGMIFAQRRLAEQSARFIVEKGVIDAAYGEDMWMGTYDEGADGDVEVLPPTGYTETTEPSGVIHALLYAHENDDSLPGTHSVTPEAGDTSLPVIDMAQQRLRVRPIALTSEENSPYFRLTYTFASNIIDDIPYVRVVSTGVDGDIRRELRMDFRIDKKIEFAVLSPNRIMIGKNVLVEGPLGSRYGIGPSELDSANGDPLVMRSDFYYLDDALNTKLDTLYAKIIDHDVDGDARLRPDHSLENLGLAGQPDLIDYDGDEYVDDFDLFLKHFDDDGDERVAYDSALAAAAGLGSVTVEYGSESDDDTQLMRLIDKALPDRDNDGVYGSASDTALGYNDGVLNIHDLYAKVRGRLAFSVAQAPWETANGASYQSVVQGPIRPELEVAPVTFETPDEQMREITTEMVDESQSWFAAHATGNFATQSASGGTQVAPSDATWEPVPFGAQGAYDYYKRRIYRNYTFNNVRIPKNTNAVFEDCTFVGATFVETQSDCSDYNWNYAGAVEKKMTEVPPGSGNFVTTYPLKFPDIEADMSGTPVSDTRLESNNLRFHNCTFLGSISGDKPDQYTHWRNKVQMTGNTRFYIDPDDQDLLNEIATGNADATDWRNTLLTISDDDREEMAKSSILMPGWSVDVGNFTNEQDADPTLTPKVKLKGTIIAGILDIRGTADVHGTLLMTFRPVAPGATLPDAAAGPLAYGGLPDAFNTTIGYFGPLDGDGEGEDPTSGSFQGFGEITLRYDPNAKLPDGIPWPIRIDAEPETYVE